MLIQAGIILVGDGRAGRHELSIPLLRERGF